MIGGYFIAVDNLPIRMIQLRPSSIPWAVMDNAVHVDAGMTGDDILWQNGLKDEGELVSTIPCKSTLVVGVTERLKERVRWEYGRKPTLKDLEGQKIVTKFPNIAEEIFSGMEVEILEQPGSTEAIQYIIPDCNGLLDVTSSGTSLIRNKFTIVEKVLDPVRMRMVNRGGLTECQEKVLVDFTQALL